MAIGRTGKKKQTSGNVNAIAQRFLELFLSAETCINTDCFTMILEQHS